MTHVHVVVERNIKSAMALDFFCISVNIHAEEIERYDMIKKSQKGIWETNVRTINLSNSKVLKWYLERKIEVGDWKALDRATLARMLGRLSIDASIKGLIKDFLRSYGNSYAKSSAHPGRTRKK